MNNVEFFDWKLNSSNPVSWVKRHYTHAFVNKCIDIHSAIHLGIIYSGQQQILTGACHCPVNVNELYLTAPWEPHCGLQGTFPREILLINIDAATLSDFFFTGRERLETILCMPPDERMKYLNGQVATGQFIADMRQLSNLPAAEDLQLLIWHRVLKFFIDVLPPVTETVERSGSYQRLLPALKQLSNRVLSLPEAAGLCNLSTSYFAAIFRKQFGLSFARYERNFRLNQAAEAVRRGAGLKAAAAEWGFCDKSHLARLLKQYR